MPLLLSKTLELFQFFYTAATNTLTEKCPKKLGHEELNFFYVLSMYVYTCVDILHTDEYDLVTWITLVKIFDSYYKNLKQKYIDAII